MKNQKLWIAHCIIKKLHKGLKSLFSYQRIRIMLRRKKSKADLLSFLHDWSNNLQSMPGSVSTGTITIVTEYNSVGIAKHGLNLFRSSCSTKGSNCIGTACLSNGDYIHIAFYHHKSLRTVVISLKTFIQTKEFLSLSVDGGFLGIHVLRLVIAHGSATKRNNTASFIKNRDHDPVSIHGMNTILTMNQ